MKPITLLLTFLLAGAGFSAGFVFGHRGAKPNAATDTAPANGSTTVSEKPLPAIKVKPQRPTEVADKSVKRMTLAEIETALDGLKSVSRDKLWERVNEIVRAVDPADIPAVMAMVAKLSSDVQNSFRYSLLPKWAETDPRAAMEFANGIKNVNDRHQAILSVLRGWAKNDALGAAAWIQQLPPGRLRNEAPAAIARALAEKDPEAAFALLKNSKADRNYGYGAYHELFDAWAGNDPAAAAAKAG